MATKPRLSIPTLVAHLRAWVTNPSMQPAGFYRRHLDFVTAMSDEAIAEAVRWARSTRGAEMALVHYVRETIL